MRAYAAKGQGVAVGGGLARLVQADGSIGATQVLDHQGLAQMLPHLLSHGTGQRIAGASRGKRHDQRDRPGRSEEHTSELQSPCNLVCRLLLEKKNMKYEVF